MNKKGKKIVTVSSIEEFRSIYLPKVRKEIILSTPEEAREYGAELAKQALEKIGISK